MPDQPLCFPNCTPTVELHEQIEREKAVIEQTKMTTSTAQTHSSISAIGTEMRPYLVLNSLQRLALY